MSTTNDLLPYDYVLRSIADLERCRRPWQIFRRGSANYCVHLGGSDAVPLVTIIDDIVVRVDPGIAWPQPQMMPSATISRSE